MKIWNTYFRYIYLYSFPFKTCFSYTNTWIVISISQLCETLYLATEGCCDSWGHAPFESIQNQNHDSLSICSCCSKKLCLLSFTSSCCTSVMILFCYLTCGVIIGYFEVVSILSILRYSKIKKNKSTKNTKLGSGEIFLLQIEFFKMPLLFS